MLRLKENLQGNAENPVLIALIGMVSWFEQKGLFSWYGYAFEFQDAAGRRAWRIRRARNPWTIS